MRIHGTQQDAIFMTIEAQRKMMDWNNRRAKILLIGNFTLSR
jgi:hypothetical protein